MADQNDIIWLDVQELVPHPDNPRLTMRQDVVDALASNMKEGFDPAHALIVRKTEGGVYQIISGHHRKAAAEQAGLQSVPCWVRDMGDEEAYMALATSNSQGELSPLEVGMHALHCVGLSKGGRGQKGGLSEYAAKVGKDAKTLRQCRDGAAVAEKVGADPQVLQDKTQHLSAIHALPESCWQSAVEAMLEGGWSASQTKAKVEGIKSLVEKIPPWFSGTFDVKGVVDSDKLIARYTRGFQAATEIADSLPELETIYEFSDSGERQEVNGREYAIHKANAVSIYPRDQFINRINKPDGLISVDEMRRIKADIDKQIADSSSSADRMVPIETEEEHQQRLQREKEAEREQMRQELRERVYLGDCRDALAKWEYGKIRLLMTDPPYGMAFQSNRRTMSDKADAIQGDASIQDAHALLVSALSSVYDSMDDDSHVVVFCHDDSFEHTKQAVQEAGYEFKRILVWVKPNHTSGDLHGCFAPRKELAVHAVKGKPDVSPRRDDVFVQERQSKQTDHPTEKPVEVLSYWMESLVGEGDLVADPFAGTGATLVAAAQIGCYWWGAEMDEDYREVAADRAVEASNV